MRCSTRSTSSSPRAFGTTTGRASAGWVRRSRRCRTGLGDLFVLVRGGAIVPHQPLVQSTSEVPKGALELRVYLGRVCRGSLYLDDGVSFDYQKGDLLRLTATCEESAGAVSVKTLPVEGSFEPWFHSIAFAIYGPHSAPKQVVVDGKTVRDFTYDGAKKVVTVVAPYAKGGETVTVTY